jgi:RNA polymerase sigma factor (sigma-70 family)
MSVQVRELVERAEAGDHNAWEQLVDQFSGLVWHVIRGFRLPRAAGEDIFQTTWLRATEHIGRMRNPDAFGGWLATTARNECLRALRHREREQLISDPGFVLIDPDASAERETLDGARNAVLWRAFAQLSPKCQQLLRILMNETQLAYEDVSALLNMPIGSIGPTRSRCLQRLRSTSDIAELERNR